MKRKTPVLEDIPTLIIVDEAAFIATKDDAGKPDVTLIDPAFRIEMAKVLGAGETEYGVGNYKNGQGLDIARIIAAAHRHLMAIEQGEYIDPKSGFRHTAHIASGMMMADYLMMRPTPTVNTLPFSFRDSEISEHTHQINDQDKSS